MTDPSERLAQMRTSAAAEKEAAKPYFARVFKRQPKAWQNDIRELQRRGMLKTVMIWEYEQ